MARNNKKKGRVTYELSGGIVPRAVVVREPGVSRDRRVPRGPLGKKHSARNWKKKKNKQGW